ncbi:hypothetical protein O0L34_g13511 [Tuta absoluta]|nr:hypothetical protein O0L34_g13511 [Tuta absoluta]
MAPPSKAALDRLVDVVNGLGTQITALNIKLNDCYDVINKQKTYIMQQEQNIRQLLMTVDEIKTNQISQKCKDEIKEHSPGVSQNLASPFHLGPVPTVPHRFSAPLLNESGPQGITIHNTMDGWTNPIANQTSNPPSCMSTPVSASAPAKKQSVMFAQAVKSPPAAAITPAAHGKPTAQDKPAAQAKPVGLITAPPRSRYLHLFNFSLETTTADITNHLDSCLKLRDVSCEKLTTHGDYSSFKLQVPAASVRSVRNRSLWPEGVSVRPFNDISTKNGLQHDSKNSRTWRSTRHC